MTDTPDKPQGDKDNADIAASDKGDTVDTPSHEERAAAALEQELEDSAVETSYATPTVASGRGRVLMVGVVAVLAIAVLANVFLGGDDKKKTAPTGEDPSNPANVSGGGPTVAPAPPSNEMQINIPQPPAPVQPPIAPPPPAPPAPATETPTDGSQTTDPNAPPPPPPPPEIKAISPFGSDNDEARRNRMRAQMLVSGVNTARVVQGVAGSGAEAEERAARARESRALEDPNRSFENDTLALQKAPVSVATRVTNLDSTIVQGKIVEAVLETAINTSLPGTIRAIVSRDIYPESGRDVMIPKGSRLIGEYNTSVLRGQERVFIIWTRVVRPDGVDIAIGSPGIDPLGRAGMNGDVDNRYMDIFSTAILTSMLSIGVAAGTEAIIPGDGTTTSNTDGSSTTTGSAGTQAGAQAVNNIGDITSNVIKDALDVRPTISVDQGTRISVFVNRDLVFPAELSEHRRFVQ